MVGRFLQYDERKGFGFAKRDVMFAETLNGSQSGGLANLNVLRKIGKERGFDIYDLLRKAKTNELSKKQSRIISDTRNKSDETINDYLTKFLLGIEIKRERGGGIMAVVYKERSKREYKIPLYRLFWFWWLLAVFLAVLSSILGLVVSIKAVQFALWSLVLVLLIVRAYLLAKSVFSAKSIKKYITQKGEQNESNHKEPTRDDVR